MDTREKILEVAETHFARHGFAGAHLQQIAADVGVQKTAVYYYFESKAALYAAVLANILEDFERAVTTATRRGPASAQGLARLLDDLNDLLAEHPNYSRILIRIFVDRVETDLSAISPTVRRIVEAVTRFYADGAERGAFRKLSARHFFQSVLGMAVFHYAASDFSAAVLGLDDIFTRSAVSWRRDEVRRLLLHGTAAD